MPSKKAVGRLTKISSQLNATPETIPLHSDIKRLLEEGKGTVAAGRALSAFLQPPRYQPTPKQFDVFRDAEKDFIEVKGIQVRRYVWNAAAPSSIILTHGFGTAAAFLSSLISHILAIKDCRVLVVDHAAHGESEGDEASLGHFIAVLKSLVETEHSEGKELHSLIGHSVGATALIMLLSKEPELFEDSKRRPSLVALNPPLQPTTLMQGFCLQHSLPLSLVDGMREAFVPSPEDVLKQKMATGGWVNALRILLVQDSSDKVARLEETRTLANSFQTSGANITFRETKGLGHFKVVGDAEVLSMIESYV